MMKLLIALFIASLTGGIDIGKVNAIKREAREAFNSGDFQRAAERYQYLVDSLGIREDEVLLNLAGARFQLNDTTAANGIYQQLTGSRDAGIRSRAYQQLGVMSTRKSQLEAAAGEFRAALQADPKNQDARFNYEAVMKKLAEQQKKQQQNKQQNKDQKNQKDQKDQKNQQNKNNQDQQKKEQQKKDQEQKEQQQKQDQEKKDQQKKEQQKKDQESKKDEKKEEQKQPSFDPERMKNMKISEEKARMILEAMKNNEVQYLQQNRRKATKPKDKGKPDW